MQDAENVVSIDSDDDTPLAVLYGKRAPLSAKDDAILQIVMQAARDVIKEHATGSGAGDSKMPTEEVEVNCYNHIQCKQEAEPGNTYCKTCERERKCQNYPHCDEKPDVGELLCNSCLEDRENQSICENCSEKVGPNETLCEECMEVESQRSNGMLWWENE